MPAPGVRNRRGYRVCLSMPVGARTSRRSQSVLPVRQPPRMSVDCGLQIEDPPDQRNPRRVRQFDRFAGRKRPGRDDRETGAGGLVGDVGADPTGKTENKTRSVELLRKCPADDLVDGVVAANVAGNGAKVIAVRHRGVVDRFGTGVGTEPGEGSLNEGKKQGAIETGSL